MSRIARRLLLVTALVTPAACSSLRAEKKVSENLRPHNAHKMINSQHKTGNKHVVSHLKLKPDEITPAAAPIAPVVSFSMPEAKQVEPPPRPTARKSTEPPLPPPPPPQKLPAPVAVTATSDSLAPSATATHFTQKLHEVKQRRTNVVQVQQTLAAEVSLLRESAQLVKTSVSQESRDQANKQVKKTEELVKGTTAMLRESRADAIADAKGVLEEIAETQVQLDSLRKEATDQLQTFDAPKLPAAAATKTPSVSATAPVVAVSSKASSTSAAEDVDDLDDGS